MQTQRNEIGMKTRRQTSEHVAKIVAAAKGSAIATAIAVEDYHKTCEVENLAKAAKTCRMHVTDIVAAIVNSHDMANKCRLINNDIGYEANMKAVVDLTPKVQEAEATLRAVNDKLMRAGLEITAERWDMLTAGNRGRAHGCTARLEMIEKALGRNKPKKTQKRGAFGKFATNQS